MDVAVIVRIATDIFLILTLPIYVLFLLTLIKYRKDEELKHAYFRFAISNGFADIGQILSILLVRELAATGLFPEPYIWMGELSAKIQYAANNLFGNAQYLGALWIAANRLTALHFPMKYKQIWTNNLIVTSMVAVQWISATTAGCITATFYNFSTEMQLDNKTVLFFRTVQPNVYGALTINLYIIVFCVLAIYSFIFSAALLKTFRRKEWTVTERIALKMAAAGFFICSGMLFASILKIFNFENSATVTLFGMTMFVSSTPYSMFIFSSVVRDRFVQFICCRSLKRLFTRVDNVGAENMAQRAIS